MWCSAPPRVNIYPSLITAFSIGCNVSTENLPDAQADWMGGKKQAPQVKTRRRRRRKLLLLLLLPSLLTIFGNIFIPLFQPNQKQKNNCICRLGGWWWCVFPYAATATLLFSISNAVHDESLSSHEMGEKNKKKILCSNGKYYSCASLACISSSSSSSLDKSRCWKRWRDASHLYLRL